MCFYDPWVSPVIQQNHKKESKKGQKTVKNRFFVFSIFGTEKVKIDRRKRRAAKTHPGLLPRRRPKRGNPAPEVQTPPPFRGVVHFGPDHDPASISEIRDFCSLHICLMTRFFHISTRIQNTVHFLGPFCRILPTFSGFGGFVILIGCHPDHQK